jgi:MoaD family protein
MRLTIKLLRPFSNIIGKKQLELDFNGNNFEDLLKILINKYPKLKKEFYTENNELTEYVCIFVNDKPIGALNGNETKLKDNDEILFFIPVSGG